MSNQNQKTGFIELNDAGINYSIDGNIVNSSPGFAVLDGDKLLLGTEAFKNARLLPRWTNNRFWNQLNSDPIPNGTSKIRHHADIAFSHLEQIWLEMQPQVNQVVVAVPGHYSREQLGLFLGMAKEAGIPIAGLVDNALITVAETQSHSNILFLDVSLHRITLTQLESDGALRKLENQTITESGLFTLWDRWANIVAKQFIQTSRYDPMHQAASEQLLFDQLPLWIANSTGARTKDFEISLPERRQFFIENSDLFGDFGNSRDGNPFFSRRIGIAKDKDGNSIENGIVAGARLSGKVTNNLRLGILNVQTEEDIANEIPATNNAVVAVQQKVFNRSNINFLFINKQATKEYAFLSEEDRFNRVIGIDYNLASKDNTWNGRYYIHKSFSPASNGNDLSAGISTEYNSRNFKIRLSGLYIEDDFRSDLGFIRRTDIFKINPNFEYASYPKNGIFQKHAISVLPIFIWRPKLNYENSDYVIISKWTGSFQNSSELTVSMFNRYTYLYDSFDPTRTDVTPLPGDQGYSYTSFEASYQSDRRKEFSVNLSPSFGAFYNGKKYSIRGRFNWRIQPYFQTNIEVNYNYIELPSPYATASIWLIGPKFSITFNKRLFWNTLIQYNNQEQNLGINSRLQWRFAPLSDLFIAYNDNYNTNTPLSPRFRSINLKLSYWLNL